MAAPVATAPAATVVTDKIDEDGEEGGMLSARGSADNLHSDAALAAQARADAQKEPAEKRRLW